MGSDSFLRQHRTIWQEHSAKDFASYESYKRAGILYVFPPFITARMGQKIGRRPQTQLCGDALSSKLVLPMPTGEPEGRQETSASCLETVKKPRRRCPGQSSGGCVRGAKSPPRVQSNRILKLFCKFQNPHSGAKRLFRHAEKLFECIA